MQQKKQIKKDCTFYTMNTSRPRPNLRTQAKQNAPAYLHFAVCLVGLHNCNITESKISITLSRACGENEWLSYSFLKREILVLTLKMYVPIPPKCPYTFIFNVCCAREILPVVTPIIIYQWETQFPFLPRTPTL